MASFLSPLNTRDDGYGGPRENRVRLPLEVLAAVRAAVGADFAVGCRFLAEEKIGVESAAVRSRTRPIFGGEFARAGVDFLSLSRGGKFEDAKQPKVGWSAYPYTGPSGYECMPTAISDAFGPFGRNVAAVAGDPRRGARRRLHDPDRARRRHLRLRAGGGALLASAPPTSSPPRASRSPIPTGSARSAWGAARRSGAASSRTTAKASTRCTSR